MYGPEVWRMNDSMTSIFKSARELGRSRLILKKLSTSFFFSKKKYYLLNTSKIATSGRRLHGPHSSKIQ